MKKGSVFFPRSLVAEPFIVGQMNEEGGDPVLGQVLPAKLGNLPAVDDWADELIEVIKRYLK